MQEARCLPASLHLSPFPHYIGSRLARPGGKWETHAAPPSVCPVWRGHTLRAPTPVLKRQAKSGDQREGKERKGGASTRGGDSGGKLAMNTIVQTITKSTVSLILMDPALIYQEG